MTDEGRQMVGILGRAAHTGFVAGDNVTRESLRKSEVYEG